MVYKQPVRIKRGEGLEQSFHFRKIMLRRRDVGHYVRSVHQQAFRQWDDKASDALPVQMNLRLIPEEHSDKECEGSSRGAANGGTAWIFS